MREKLHKEKPAGKTGQAPERSEKAREEQIGGDREIPGGGSAFVQPTSFGGASLVKDARDAALKLRSLLG